MLISESSLSQTVEVAQGYKPFCYSRNESEKIDQCLRLQKYYIKELETKESENFLSDNQKLVLSFIAGAWMGYEVTRR